MQQHEYDAMVNFNTLKCWNSIALVLLVSYIIEIFKGARDITYVASFCLVMYTPIIISTITYCKNKASKAIRIQFAIGYSIFYAFTLITTQSPAAFVYIIPMASVMISYCSVFMVVGTFGSAMLTNVLVILYMYKTGNILMMNDMGTIITFWEIQIAAIALTGLFLYFSMDIIKKRNDIIEDVLDDIYKDALTGIDNVRFLNDNEFSLFDYERNDTLCIAFIDIDDFKHFNTNYGHSFGDLVLKRLADVLLHNTSNIRHTYAIRNGGDEFLIISRTTSDEQFKQLLEQVRYEVENTQLLHKKEPVGVTISIGMATKNLDGASCESFRDLYNVADSRNQSAKDVGKNAIVS